MPSRKLDEDIQGDWFHERAREEGGEGDMLELFKAKENWRFTIFLFCRCDYLILKIISLVHKTITFFFPFLPKVRTTIEVEKLLDYTTKWTL